MKIKVAEATEPQLDWLVAKCEGVLDGDRYPDDFWDSLTISDEGELWSTNWRLGGPIIERESITLRTNANVPGHWAAFIDFGGSNCSVRARRSGPTSLIAAMRCYVASKLGDEVDVPEELL